MRLTRKKKSREKEMIVMVETPETQVKSAFLGGYQLTKEEVQLIEEKRRQQFGDRAKRATVDEAVDILAENIPELLSKTVCQLHNLARLNIRERLTNGGLLEEHGEIITSDVRFPWEAVFSKQEANQPTFTTGALRIYVGPGFGENITYSNLGLNRRNPPFATEVNCTPEELRAYLLQGSLTPEAVFLLHNTLQALAEQAKKKVEKNLQAVVKGLRKAELQQIVRKEVSFAAFSNTGHDICEVHEKQSKLLAALNQAIEGLHASKAITKSKMLRDLREDLEEVRKQFPN